MILKTLQLPSLAICPSNPLLVYRVYHILYKKMDSRPFQWVYVSLYLTTNSSHMPLCSAPFPSVMMAFLQCFWNLSQTSQQLYQTTPSVFCHVAMFATFCFEGSQFSFYRVSQPFFSRDMETWVVLHLFSALQHLPVHSGMKICTGV